VHQKLFVVLQFSVARVANEDLVCFGGKDRRDDGLEITIGKFRDRRYFVPLRDSELAEIDSWSCSNTSPWIVSGACATD
jgi:hypothetical protein